MNRRSIERNLARVHDDFVSSIEDSRIRDIVDKNSIITGGCIVSMLLNEKVNDYDYYFTNLSDVSAVAHHYVNIFNKNHGKRLSSLTTIPVVCVEHDRVRINIKSAGIISEDSDVAEYRYFEQHPDEEGDRYVSRTMRAVANVVADADTVSDDFLEAESRKPYRPVFLTDNAITLSERIQLIVRFYGSPSIIHRNFDFVHCMSYWESRNRKLHLNPEAMESIMSRELKYVGSLYPVSSVVRMRKFLRKGWWINAGQILKILLQISELNLHDITVLEEQLTGVDTAYFFDLIERLKRKQDSLKDSDTVGMLYIVSIIDRMF